MSRAVSFRLNDPGEMLALVQRLISGFGDMPSLRPLVMMERKTGNLREVFDIGRIRRRDNYTLGSVSRSTIGTLTFHGPFFADCRDEVEDVCQQLGVRCRFREK